MITKVFTKMPRGAKLYKKLPIVTQAKQINKHFEVDTLEGTMSGKPGDYLVKGIKGELYPCDKEIFEETYIKL